MPIRSRGEAGDQVLKRDALLEDHHVGAAAFLDFDAAARHHDRVAFGERIGLRDLRGFGHSHHEAVPDQEIVAYPLRNRRCP
jgi:hypothetical protein